MMLEYNSTSPLGKIPIDDMVDGKVKSAIKLDAGANSQIFKLSVDDGKEYVLKLYLGDTFEGNSRLDREFCALQFLNEIGITCVPTPVISNPEYGCAIYSFVAGDKIYPPDVTSNDIDQVSKFLCLLHEVAMDSKTELLPNASEACFSVYSIMQNLRERVAKLCGIDKNVPCPDLLFEFLDNEFRPALDKIEIWCRQHATITSIDVDKELSDYQKTLSPSDIGFHNCLKTYNGELVFLDFEYFGWDDPAKMISDFLLHPAMCLTDDLKKQFYRSMIESMDSDGGLYNRVETVFPLFGLKWCLIMLNIYLPEYRISKGILSDDWSELQYRLEVQLTKSKKMLERVWSEYAQFPFRNN